MVLLVRDSFSSDFMLFSRYGQGVNRCVVPRALTAGNVHVSTALHLIPEIGGNDLTYAFIAGLTPAAANPLSDQALAATKQSIEVNVLPKLSLHDQGS